MEYATARNFRAAIDARLKPQSMTDDPRALVQIRKEIVFDRFPASLIDPLLSGRLPQSAVWDYVVGEWRME
ncbi:MAG: hypothetical protein H0T93_02840 [Chloroflexia bacterium]|nr:hypothetical protein [Chloroflexia bacterium]